MDRQILNFTANEQTLIVENPIRISTNKVNYIEAHFSLGANWSGYDSVRAVWFNDYQTISTVLDSQGVCRVPFEVMKRKGKIRVDLVGSISENDVLTDRLTSYPVVAVIVDCVAPITGAETSPITPSQFEQFVANVRADADRAEAGATSAETSAGESEASATASAQSATASANSASQAQTYAQNAQNYAVSAETAKDDAIDAKEDAESAKADAESARDQILGMRATANTLAEGSDATASYSNGLLTLGIPRGNTGAKGDKGDKGDTGATPNLSIGTVETLPPTGSSEVTITGTAENPVLNFKLVKGDTGEVTQAEFDEAVTDLKSDFNNSFNTCVAERHWFVAGRYLKADDTFAIGSKYAYSLAGIFKPTSGLIKITSLSGIFDFSVVDRDAHTLTAWSDEITIASGNYTINLRKKDGSAIVGADISDVLVYVSGFDFYTHTHIKLEHTTKLSNYSEYISGRQLVTNGDTEGLGNYTTVSYNYIRNAFYSDVDIDVWVGRSDQCVADIFVDGVLLASVSQGKHYTIPAGTEFVIGWHNIVQSSIPTGTNIFILVKNAEIANIQGIAQYFSNPQTFSISPDVGCSFLFDDKVFSISDNGTYCVTKGETVIAQNQQLDVGGGHANSCNFDGGKVYVSDWDNPETIHVYDVDSDNNTLTHIKDITIPIEAEAGSTEYYVFDNEKQIISLGWKSGNSGTNPNVLTYALWVLTTDGYIKSWERYATRPIVLQSMTVQDKYIYYIECYGSSGSYKFINVNRINIDTGITEYTSQNPTGSILNNEVESIIPIGNQVFLLVTNSGKVYLFAYVL